MSNSPQLRVLPPFHFELDCVSVRLFEKSSPSAHCTAQSQGQKTDKITQDQQKRSIDIEKISQSRAETQAMIHTPSSQWKLGTYFPRRWATHGTHWHAWHMKNEKKYQTWQKRKNDTSSYPSSVQDMVSVHCWLHDMRGAMAQISVQSMQWPATRFSF
jgi:hypothetical protein